MNDELPPMPDTIEEAHKTLRTIYRHVLARTHLFIGQDRWTEGHWFYRDRSTGKLYLVAGRFREGVPVAIMGWETGILLVGVTGKADEIKRRHAQGIEIVPTFDGMGDFESMAEAYQGRRLT